MNALCLRAHEPISVFTPAKLTTAVGQSIFWTTHINSCHLIFLPSPLRVQMYQPALWHGYSLYLLQFSSVKITDIKDIDQFMVCFFPEGFDADHDTLAMKVDCRGRMCDVCL